MEPTQSSQTHESSVEPSDESAPSPLSRRGFLRTAGVVGLTGVAAGLAACQNATNPQWSFGPAASMGAPAAAASAAP